MTVSRSLFRVPTVLALSAVVATCASPQSRNPFASTGAGSGSNSIQVRVENQNFGDATVYAIRSGQRIRLGQVTGKSEKSFSMPWRFSLPLQFEVDIVGGRGCGVRPISVDPGDKVWVRVPSQIGASPCYSGKG